MNESLGLGECKELEHFCWKDVKDNLSYKAIDANGNCVGVFLSALAFNSELDSEQQVDDDDLIYKKHEKFYRIIKITDALDRRVNLPQRYPEVREYVAGKVISVDGMLRGRGIASQLLERTLQEMQQRSLPLMTIQCSSLFSAQVVLKMGFQLIDKIPYKEFLMDGKQAIAPKDPHTEMSAFMKWVDEKQQQVQEVK